MNEVPPLRKYYIHDGEQQTGPFLLEDLEQMPLASTTMVWYKGLGDWQEATSIEELLPIINHTVPPHQAEEEVPPPFKGAVKPGSPDKAPVFRNKKSPSPVFTGAADSAPRRNDKSTSGLLKFFVAFVLLALLGAAIYNVQKYRSNRITTEEAVEEPTYEEQVLSIEDQEKAAPRKFLKAGGTYKEMVFTGKFKIDGTITNTATVAKFKNVVIEVSYYTSKNKYISAERFTMEDTFPAGSTKEFKLKLDPPKGAENCKWKAVTGTAY